MAHAQRGLKSIIQKYPNDIVFLSALRTPITRSRDGGLCQAYPEQMLAAVCPRVSTFSLAWMTFVGPKSHS